MVNGAPPRFQGQKHFSMEAWGKPFFLGIALILSKTQKGVDFTRKPFRTFKKKFRAKGKFPSTWVKFLYR
jgi:hypothetical protein